MVSSAQPHHTSGTVPLSTRLPTVLSPAPTLQIPSLPRSISSNFSMPLIDSSDPIINSNSRVANLLMPSSFFSPPSSSSALMPPPMSTSIPTAAALHPPLNLQRPHHGTPMLQPFPPPTPPISLTPTSTSSPNYGPVNRDKVRDALLMLVQVLSYLFFSSPPLLCF